MTSIYDLPAITKTIDAYQIEKEKLKNVDSIILCFGKTQVGKTTAINFFKGVDYDVTWCRPSGYQAKPQSGSAVPADTGGDGRRPDTLYPKVHKVSHRGRVLAVLDAPGVNTSGLVSDERSIAERMLVHMACQRVKVKAILVFLTRHDFEANTRGLEVTLKHLKQVLSIQGLNQSNVFFVISKKEKENTLEVSQIKEFIDSSLHSKIEDIDKQLGDIFERLKALNIASSMVNKGVDYVLAELAKKFGGKDFFERSKGPSIFDKLQDLLHKKSFYKLIQDNYHVLGITDPNDRSVILERLSVLYRSRNNKFLQLNRPKNSQFSLLSKMSEDLALEFITSVELIQEIEGEIAVCQKAVAGGVSVDYKKIIRGSEEALSKKQQLRDQLASSKELLWLTRLSIDKHFNYTAAVLLFVALAGSVLVASNPPSTVAWQSIFTKGGSLHKAMSAAARVGAQVADVAGNIAHSAAPYALTAQANQLLLQDIARESLGEERHEYLALSDYIAKTLSSFFNSADNSLTEEMLSRDLPKPTVFAASEDYRSPPALSYISRTERLKLKPEICYQGFTVDADRATLVVHDSDPSAGSFSGTVYSHPLLHAKTNVDFWTLKKDHPSTIASIKELNKGISRLQKKVSNYKEMKSKNLAPSSQLTQLKKRLDETKKYVAGRKALYAFSVLYFNEMSQGEHSDTVKGFLKGYQQYFKQRRVSPHSVLGVKPKRVSALEFAPLRARL